MAFSFQVGILYSKERAGLNGMKFEDKIGKNEP
jgi:hypothetical protein